MTTLTLGQVFDLMAVNKKDTNKTALRFKNQYKFATFDDSTELRDYIEYINDGAEAWLSSLDPKTEADAVKACNLIKTILNSKRYPEIDLVMIGYNLRKSVRRAMADATVAVAKKWGESKTLAPDDTLSWSVSMESDSDGDKVDIHDQDIKRTVEAETAESDIEFNTDLMAENDRLRKEISEFKQLLSLLVENATVDSGWKPFILSLIEKKM